MEKHTRKKITVDDIVVIGFMAALVFVSTKFYIPISTGIDNTRIHFGNIFCLLAGLLFGGLRGGTAAGIGSMLFDLTDAMYVNTAPFTLIFKFTMGFLCGFISYRANRLGKRAGYNFLGAVLGQSVYMILYLSKGFFEAVWFQQIEAQTAWISVGIKAATSSINAVFAIVISVPFALALKKDLNQLEIYKRVMRKKL